MKERNLSRYFYVRDLVRQIYTGHSVYCLPAQVDCQGKGGVVLRRFFNMAGRKRLKGVADGLLGSFRSRNNDVDGYWGLGKLYKFAVDLEIKTVIIDLKMRTMSPSSDEFEPMITFFGEMFDRLLDKHNVSPDRVSSVKIVVVFEAEYVHVHHFRGSGIGKPCNIRCDIEDDRGHHHVAHAYLNCRPHDPLRESKRAE